MTMEEFELFEESHFYQNSQPPAFLKSIKENEKKEKEKEENNNNENINENRANG